MKKVSIIIPVHNSDKYLHKCVDSCLNQTLPLEEYEIILVDDCSVDASKEVIQEYADKYCNVIPIYLKKNMRQGGARNRGLELAKGKYVAFVDSDDWIESDMCEKLYKAACENDADMAGGNYFVSTEQGDNEIILRHSSCDFREGQRLVTYVRTCDIL